MSFFPKNFHYIGIDAQLSTLKIASIRKKGSSYEVVSLNETKSVFPSESYLCSTGCAKHYLIRSFETPLVKERDIFASLDFQAESHLPYGVDQAIIQGQIVRQHERSTQVSVASIRKDHLKLHLDALRTHHIEPDFITSSHFSLAALSTLLPSSSSLNLYVNVGRKEVTCTLAEHGKLLSGYAFDASLDLKNELQKIVLSLKVPFTSIFLLGDIEQSTVHQIADVTGKSVHTPFSPFSTLSQNDFMSYALAIGTALAATQKTIPNFRKKEFSYPHPFKRLKKPLTFFGSVACLLTLACFCLTQLALSYQKKELAHSYQELLVQEDKQTHTPKQLVDYKRALATLQKEIEQKPDTFALYPLVPKAKEVLGWLAAAPVSIDMNTFHYTMVKRPTFSQRNERYQVKVSLEFSAPVAHARAFHEMLLATNPFVDAKQELQWSMSRDGTYRTSFYLKDKTRYL